MLNNFFVKIYLFTILSLTFISANILTIDIQSFHDYNNSIQITITNNSNEDIKISKNDIPYENKIRKDIFNIFSNSEKIPYIGKLIKLNTDKQEYIILRPYENYSTKINLLKYYDLPSNEVVVISYKKDIIGHNYPIEKYFYSFTTKIHPYKKKFKTLSKSHVLYNQCSQSQIRIINNATLQAKTLTHMAYEILLYEQGINIWSENYTTWFGSPSIARQNSVLSSLRKIYKAFETKTLHYDCSCTDEYYAYVYPNIPYDIYLCNGFWSAEIVGSDSQTGILVNQMSKFDNVANTQNHTLGESEAKRLASEFPQYTITNADSYEYFIENLFKEDKEFLWLVPLISLML